jgi:prepilin-type N-terminal cleavage/methylation domain-containing protein
MEAARPHARTSERAFTLIELLAVLLIIGLVFGIGLPNLSLGTGRALRGETEKLAADLSYTRQRAVATGTPHRVVIDLDGAGWWIESWPEEASPFAIPTAAVPEGRREIALSAPASEVGEPRPLPAPFGRPRALPESLRFESVETPASGLAAEGQVELVFDADGTATPARLVLVNESGYALQLEMSRLADEIRISEGE